MLIKGIAARLGVTWSLANEWAPIASRLLERQTRAQPRALGAPPRLNAVFRLLGSWAVSKVSALVLRLPAPVRRVVAAAALRVRKLREGRSTQNPGEASGAEPST